MKLSVSVLFADHYGRPIIEILEIGICQERLAWTEWFFKCIDRFVS